jgi:predicted TIM-barrel fold metal-dependent hydrolase
MPYLSERFARAHQFSKVDLKARVPDVLAALNKFYYDTAQAAFPQVMGSFTKVIKLSQLLFGTDFPYFSSEETAKGLAGCGFTPAELEAIDRGNAERLIPRLKA